MRVNLKIIANVFIACLSVNLMSNAFAQQDPFFQDWKNFDGVNTYTLNISQSAAPGKNYHIAYNYLGGESSTDMCQITSNVSFTCDTGETVTRDDANHRVTLISHGKTYEFYDPKYMPKADFIFGRWHCHISRKYIKREDDYNILIAKTPDPTKYYVATTYSDSNGNREGSDDFGVLFDMTKNADGTVLLKNSKGATTDCYKYVPQKKQILSPGDHTNNDSSLDACVMLSGNNDSMVFTKVE